MTASQTLGSRLWSSIIMQNPYSGGEIKTFRRWQYCRLKAWKLLLYHLLKNNPHGQLVRGAIEIATYVNDV